MEHVRCVATVCQNVQYAEKPSKEESCFIEQKTVVDITKNLIPHFIEEKYPLNFNTD